MVLTIIGLLAGLAAWPVAEVFLVLQSSFSTYFVFSTLLGISFGLVLGAFFGSSEGIIQGSVQQSMSGMTFGALVGMMGASALHSSHEPENEQGQAPRVPNGDPDGQPTCDTKRREKE